MNLYEALAMHVAEWRQDKYKHEKHSAIAEILEWAQNRDLSAEYQAALNLFKRP